MVNVEWTGVRVGNGKTGRERGEGGERDDRVMAKEWTRSECYIMAGSKPIKFSSSIYSVQVHDGD